MVEGREMRKDEKGDEIATILEHRNIMEIAIVLVDAFTFLNNKNYTCSNM